jgi:hypothetical protein
MAKVLKFRVKETRSEILEARSAVPHGRMSLLTRVSLSYTKMLTGFFSILSARLLEKID